MDANTFNPNHPRAKKAILKKHHAKIFVCSLIVMILLFTASAYLLFIANPLGWIPAGFAAPFFMLAVWSEVELKRVPLGNTNDINDLLSADVLTILRKFRTPSAASYHLIDDTISGWFLRNRFGLLPDIVENIAANLPQDFTPIFMRAREIRAVTEASQINGGILAVAIITSYPAHEDLLRSLKLDVDDLLAGVTWYTYLHNMMKTAGKRVRNGGIARDLNFGYIPTLQHFGQNLSDTLSRSARSQINRTARKAALEKMLQIFSSNAHQNIALIGPEGSGKSILVNAFAACLLDETMKLPQNLRYRQVFKLDAAALLAAAGNTKGSIENLLNRLFNEAYAAKNIIIYLNNAQLFFKDGTGSVDLTNLLMPVIEAGRLRIILSIEEQDFLRISAGNSSLANSLNRVFVEPTDEKDTMNVMEDQVPYFEARFNVIYDYRALKEAYRLGSRYVADRAMPGRALRLLELGAQYADGNLVTARSIQMAVEKNLGVKVQVASDAEDRSKLLDLETIIHQRLIGQDRAVKTVSDALRRAAAGVRNEKRPIGTFLFMGPTGVGKTELAKAISTAYFNGEKEIIRLDLNEFVTEASVERLIADAATDAGSLTAQITKRPFSVVLLDEIEKAHPAVLTTLLQMLDEGVLRDINNREVSFRDAIIVATTNASSLDVFKPEFINRFDEICYFEPLTKDQLLQIVDLNLASVNKTLANQKITIRLSDDARELLAEKGYDPKLGARPLRRMVQQSVENLVAQSILMGEARPGVIITYAAKDLAAELGL